MNSLPRIGSLVSAVIVLLSGCDDSAARKQALEQARSQVQRWATDLDSRTTPTGVYLRVADDEIKETDPWGTRIKVAYAQGGVAETVTVRSAGPDRQFDTADDVTAQGMAANLKGIGEGIKKNAEATAAKAAKGMVKGAVEGIKETMSRKPQQPD